MKDHDRHHDDDGSPKLTVESLHVTGTFQACCGETISRYLLTREKKEGWLITPGDESPIRAPASYSG